MKLSRAGRPCIISTILKFYHMSKSKHGLNTQMVAVYDELKVLSTLFSCWLNNAVNYLKHRRM
jgi:hypothetical protein